MTRRGVGPLVAGLGLAMLSHATSPEYPVLSTVAVGCACICFVQAWTAWRGR